MSGEGVLRVGERSQPRLFPEEKLHSPAWEILTLAVATGESDREQTAARSRKLLKKRA